MTPPLSIVQLLAARQRQTSKRGHRSDRAHLAIVIECGGMRGIVAGGFVAELCSQGLSECFDSVHGSSAGASVGAYFLANQPDDGLEIYRTDICNRRVVNPYGFFSKPCMVETDYIVDVVINKKRKLDVSEVVKSPGLLNVITTAATDGAPTVHNRFDCRDDVLIALKASLRVPGPCEPGVLIHGKRHLDGGLTSPLPVFSAVLSEATHILVVGTQTAPNYVRKNPMSRVEGAWLAINYGVRFGRAYVAANLPPRYPQQQSTVTQFICRGADGTHCDWYTVDHLTLTKVEHEARSLGKAFVQRVRSTPCSQPTSP
jgi:predicted patatin/cPLA2 family phospholipase